MTRVFRNPGLKIISLVLAVGLWYHLSGVASAPTTLVVDEVPVRVLAVPSFEAKVVLVPERVSVTLEGPASHLSGLRDHNVLAYVLLPASPSDLGGARDLPVHVAGLPGGVFARRIEPAYVRVELARQ